MRLRNDQHGGSAARRDNRTDSVVLIFTAEITNIYIYDEVKVTDCVQVEWDGQCQEGEIY